MTKWLRKPKVAGVYWFYGDDVRKTEPMCLLVEEAEYIGGEKALCVFQFGEDALVAERLDEWCSYQSECGYWLGPLEIPAPPEQEAKNG